MSGSGRRILFVSFVADSEWTGMGRWTHRIAAQLEQRGWHVELWFADRFPAVGSMGRLAVLLFPVVLAGEVARRRHDFDVAVIHEPGGYWYGALRRLNRSLPPMLVMCHNVESRHFRDMKRYAAMGLADPIGLSRIRAPLLRHWQSDGAIRRADHVVCLSSVDVQYIVERLGVGADRVTRMTNGVTESDFTDRPAERRGHAVLWVGGWLDVKGKRVIPRLWREVRDRVPTARLTLVGTGSEPGEVLRAFDEADQESVEVLPRLTDPRDMKAQYAKHDAFLLTSLSEGSPLSLLEALAAGLPVVATRVGGVPDIVTHEVTGLLCEPGDVAAACKQVQRVLLERETATRLSGAGQARARELTWESAASDLLRAAAAVLDRGEADHGT